MALYILNNKRTFVTDMERRYEVTINVQASERMQGANFAIERSAAAQPVAPKSAERPVVNMEWGFEGQEEDEGAGEPAGASGEREREGERGSPAASTSARPARGSRRRAPAPP